MSKNILAEICQYKLQEVSASKQKCSLRNLEEHIAEQADPVRPFIKSLEDKVAQGQVGLITEVKKASPSRGVIRPDFNPVEIARIYEASGAACVSVLTDMHYFHGQNQYVMQVREQIKLPVLRKDFMLDPYQIYESRELGADCILLIMAALSDAQAQELESVAIELGMDVLIETHTEEEVARALALKSRLIGINNRDLIQLKTDIAVTERLVADIPEGYTIVSESGIRTQADIARLSQSGVECFLVGTSLMLEQDIGCAVQQLIKGV